MTTRLDILQIKDLITAPVAVTTDYVSEVIDIANREDEFSVQVGYTNGVGVDANIAVEVSNDGQNFGVISDVDKQDDGVSGHIFDFGGTGTAFLRVRVTMAAGSLELTQILYKAKRRL